MDEETVNGLTPEVPCTKKVEVEVVALMPDTTPLSRKRPVERPVEEVQRARYPVVPPVTPVEVERPSDEVATQSVEVPVDQSTCPTVPDALVVSRKRPERERLVVVALIAVRLEVDAVPMNPFCTVIPVPDAEVKVV